MVVLLEEEISRGGMGRWSTSRSEVRWMLDLDSRSIMYFVPPSNCVCRASAGLLSRVSANGSSLVLWEAVWIHLSSAVVIACSLPFRFPLPIQIHINPQCKRDVNDDRSVRETKAFALGIRGARKVWCHNEMLMQLGMQLWECLQRSYLRCCRQSMPLGESGRPFRE